MASTIITLRNPLGTLVFQESALSTTPVQIATSAQTYYHFELDNTANSAITYYKFYQVGSAPDPTDGATHPRLIIPVPATTKTYVFLPGGLYQATGNFVIATSTLESAGAQSAPTTAVGLTILG